MNKITYRHWQILLTILSLLVWFSSLYFQYVRGLQPCPLCLMQRLAAFLLFSVGLAGVYSYNLRYRKLLLFLQCLLAASGLFFACRQLWLQSLPASQTPACMPGLDVLIQYFPWQDVLRTLLWGTGECAEISWQWLGLSMPAWSALYFLLMLGAAIAILILLRLDKSLRRKTGK